MRKLLAALFVIGGLPGAAVAADMLVGEPRAPLVVDGHGIDAISRLV
jgi:hypothetical protein